MAESRWLRRLSEPRGGLSWLPKGGRAERVGLLAQRRSLSKGTRRGRCVGRHCGPKGRRRVGRAAIRSKRVGRSSSSSSSGVAIRAKGIRGCRLLRRYRLGSSANQKLAKGRSLRALLADVGPVRVSIFTINDILGSFADIARCSLHLRLGILIQLSSFSKLSARKLASLSLCICKILGGGKGGCVGCGCAYRFLFVAFCLSLHVV